MGVICQVDRCYSFTTFDVIYQLSGCYYTACAHHKHFGTYQYVHRTNESTLYLQTLCSVHAYTLVGDVEMILQFVNVVVHVLKVIVSQRHPPNQLIPPLNSQDGADMAKPDMAEPVPVAGTAHNDDEEPVCSTVSGHPGLTLPKPETSVTRAKNDTPAEELLPETSADGQGDMMARVAAAISDVPSTAAEGLLLEVSEVPAVAATETAANAVAEDEQAAIASLNVPTSEEPTREQTNNLAEDPFPGSSIDEAPAKDEREKGDDVEGTPASVLDDDSAPVISSFDDGSADLVDESLFFDVAPPMAVEPTAATTIEVTLQ